MTPLTPEMIERAARAMLRAEPWSSFWSDDDARKLASAALTAALGEGVTGWRDIASAPHETNVLLAYWDELLGGWRIETGMASWGWRREGVSNMSLHGHATHWMPLPPSPSPAQEPT